MVVSHQIEELFPLKILFHHNPKYVVSHSKYIRGKAFKKRPWSSWRGAIWRNILLYFMHDQDWLYQNSLVGTNYLFQYFNHPDGHAYAADNLLHTTDSQNSVLMSVIAEVHQCSDFFTSNQSRQGMFQEKFDHSMDLINVGLKTIDELGKPQSYDTFSYDAKNMLIGMLVETLQYDEIANGSVSISESQVRMIQKYTKDITWMRHYIKHPSKFIFADGMKPLYRLAKRSGYRRRLKHAERRKNREQKSHK